MVALDGLSDTVELKRSPRRSVECPGIAPQENLAWHALDRLEERVGRALPCAVHITKRIPAQAGLGGGSSDAASTLILADTVFGLGLSPDELEEVAARVGSDVPFFIRAGAQWAAGRGEVLRPATAPEFHALIVVPAVGLSTRDVYRAFDELPVPPDTDPADPPSFPGILRNDLWPAALRCHAALADLDAALRDAGARQTLLCGSGTAMAGFFPDAGAARRAQGAFTGTTTAVVRPLAVP